MKNTINEILKKKEWLIQQPVIWKQPTCETFILIRITHSNTFSKYQQNWSFNISLIWQNLRRKTLSHANFKKKILRAVVSLSRNLRWYILVKRQNFINTFKIYLESWKFFHKILNKICLKVGKPKLKISEFQKLYVRRPGNRKHSFSIT